MDTLSHYLWAVALYWYFRKPKKWLSGITGALPDLLSFGPLIVANLLTGFSRYEPGGPPPLHSIPSWVFGAYDVTHSLVVVGIVAFALFFLARKWWWLTWGWILHILADIPTHTRAYFPTPFLWPISELTFDGFSWGQWWFVLLNYGLIAAAFTLLVRRDRAMHRKRDA